VRLFKRIICDALFATKVQHELSNCIASFAAGGSSLDRQKSRQFARHLSDADLNQRMGKDAHGMLALSLSCVPPARQLKREWSLWREFGWTPTDLCDLSKG
jgi:hypothetical protein